MMTATGGTPGQSEATFEAYGDVELQLLHGRAVRCPSLTVGEAVRYLRLLGQTEVDPEAHARFVKEFPVRIGITDERLVDLGLGIERLAFGDLTYREAAQLVEVLMSAALTDDVRQRSRAQAEFLERFPAAVGLTAPSPADVFAAGHVFTNALYRMIYGLAEDFCTHLSSAPGVQVLMIQGSSSSTQASTT